MKKILFFILSAVVCIFNAGGAVRDENAAIRGKNNTISNNQQPARSISNRSAIKKSISPRTASTVSVLQPTRSAISSAPTRTPVNRTSSISRNASIKKQNVSARAATQTSSDLQGTKTGQAYEECKTAFFTCMDQFCELKSDAFRRCSCSNRIFGFQEITDTYQDVGEQLTEFNENLDAVGLTKEQATAMKTATEGEDALAEDKSASKQLLQAIMNAIRGEDSTVGGKYKDLNSITISPDMSNAFGMTDYGQIIASYNGTNLYKAVYPKCRNAVKDDCTDASLQRAVNAYLMAIEQDCNTVETALTTKQRELKSAAYESSAMLDLARVENRQNRNSDDVAICLVNIETAIQSEEVCGAGYHKCLDNGQYIDVNTGTPLAGVQDFYKLGSLLTFKSNQDIQKQKLSTLSDNRNFVQFFESKTKKFAKDALNKCSEKSDLVWQEYLDRALLDIYYAQQSKVKTIKESCFTLVAACYDNQKTAITEAMINLTGDYSEALEPATITLTQQMCSDYITSCDSMFAGNIVQQYIENKYNTDSELACREIAKRCFDSFGGTSYENFYLLQNGLFSPGKAIDWFALYDCKSGTCDKTTIISPCAKELYETTGCNEPEMLERVFGGLDKYGETLYKYEIPDGSGSIDRQLRQFGVASEIYAQIVDILSNQCNQLHGYFVEKQFVKLYGYQQNNSCEINNDHTSVFTTGDSSGLLHYWYHFKENENMCPAGYSDKIDTESWGICSCWENGNYRSKNGLAETCLPLLPILNTSYTGTDDSDCTEEMLKATADNTLFNQNKWCYQDIKSSLGQICPMKLIMSDSSDGGKNKCATKGTGSSPNYIIGVIDNQGKHLHNK